MTEKLVEEKTSKGVTPYGWVDYENTHTDTIECVQAIEWPNGEGVIIICSDDIKIDVPWEKWEAMVEAVKALNKVEPEQKQHEKF